MDWLFEKILRKIPEDPVVQSLFMYVMNGTIFTAFVGSLTYNIIELILQPSFPSFFNVLIFLGLSGIMLLSLKSSRAGWIAALEIRKSESKKANTLDDIFKTT